MQTACCVSQPLGHIASPNLLLCSIRAIAVQLFCQLRNRFCSVPARWQTEVSKCRSDGNCVPDVAAEMAMRWLESMETTHMTCRV